MRRLVWLAGLVVLVDTIFYAVVVPLLPTYADELGLSKAAAGVLGGSYAAGTLVGSLPSGWLAGWIGPRLTVVCGLVLLGISSFGFGLGEHIVVLDAARFLQGIGGACSWAGALAWVTRTAPPERRGALIGVVLGLGTAGALLGPVVGGLAEATSRTVVFAAVLPVAAAMALAAVRVRAPPLRPEATDGGLPTLRRSLGRGDVRAGLWLIALPAATSGTINVVGSLRLGELGAGAAAVAATFLVAAGAEAAVAPVAGRLSDRFGRLVPIRAALLASAALLVLVCLPGDPLLLAVAVLALILGVSFLWAPAMAVASDAAERSDLRQGVAFGLVNLAWAGGQTVGSIGSGALADATTDAVPFLLAAASCAAALVALAGRTALTGVPQRV